MTAIAERTTDTASGTEEAPGSLSLDTLRGDDVAWDLFVESSGVASYPQLSAWATIKRDNGWRACRVVADGGSGPIGAQVLIHGLGPTPFGVGFAARGPVATRWDEPSVRAFTREVRRLTTRERLSHVTVDPEIEDPSVAAAFGAAGWRPAKTWIDPESTRILDLRRPEDELWGDLRSKWRQYVQKARRAGVVVVEGGVSDLEEFHAVLVETAERAGFAYRTLASYRRIFELFAATGRARLLIARLPDGSAGATLMLIRCGGRVVEPYGGMTPAGAAARANYLVKWEAIRSSREAGAWSYDMWGLVNPGIAQFKAGFGGREIHYVGAWDLVRLPPLRTAMHLARRFRRRLAGIRENGADAPTGTGSA
ncbi:MAG: peptidoglycan bridge formation glycyltransferase FemA/FemB family protein [Chloroflexi bacterium]|nr:peptidoglycan bridge formation glycyltransferase FemA/FemB family protein [Chloroflexota bacterium]